VLLTRLDSILKSCVLTVCNALTSQVATFKMTRRSLLAFLQCIFPFLVIIVSLWWGVLSFEILFYCRLSFVLSCLPICSKSVAYGDN